MIDYSSFDAVMAKIKARQAELDKPGQSGWDRLANNQKATKEFQKELDAAKEGMYAQTPGGNYGSFLQYHNPFRGARATSKAAYMQAQYRGMDDAQIRRAGYKGEYVNNARPSSKSSVGPSKYVAPENRDEAYYEQVKADYEAGPPPSPVQAALGIGTKSPVQQYNDKFNEKVVEGGGIPTAPVPESKDVTDTTAPPAPASSSPAPASSSPTPASSSPAPKDVYDVSAPYPDRDSEGNRIPSGSGVKASAQDPTSVGLRPGDAGAGNVVAPIGVDAKSTKNYVPGQLKSNKGYLTRGNTRSTREYYAARFS